MKNYNISNTEDISSTSTSQKKDFGSKKKIIIGVVVAIVLLGAIGSNSGSDSSNVKDEITDTEIEETATNTEEIIEIQEPQTEQEKIKKILTDRISSKYSETDIDNIVINKDLGTDADDDFVALIYLTWNVKNYEDTSKEVTKMYSDDLASFISNENAHVQEIAVFWTIPYLNVGAKYSYELNDNKMCVSDTAWSKQ